MNPPTLSRIPVCVLFKQNADKPCAGVSAIAYASIVTLIVATRYLDIFRWTLKLTYMALGTAILAEVTGKLVLNHGLATQFRPRAYSTLSKQTLDAVIGDVHELVNFFVIEAQRILYVENIGASVAVSLRSTLVTIITIDFYSPVNTY